MWKTPPFRLERRGFVFCGNGALFIRRWPKNGVRILKLFQQLQNARPLDLFRLQDRVLPAGKGA